MNIKKSFLVAVATVTAAVSVSAIAASAVPLGTTNVDVPFEVVAGEAKAVTADVYGKKVTVDIPADALTAGQYFFEALAVADSALESAFDQTVNADYKDIFEIAVRNEDGTISTLETVKVTVAADKGYDTVYAVDGDSFKLVDSTVDENGITFVVANGSKVVLAKATEITSDPISEPVSQVSQVSQVSTPSSVNSEPTKTGDNGAATATVFAVMGVVALGTALAATKMKKSAK